MKQFFCILLSILFLVPNFINKDINEFLPYDKLEKFNPKLDSLNDIDKIERYVDNITAENNLKSQTFEYVAALENILEERFYHGFSHYTLKENWIAAVGERLTGIGLSAKVKLNDILKHQNAACSQQSLVMMDILKRKGINYRKVGFPHHFALEASINNKWFFFDPNMEPLMNEQQRIEENWKLSCDSLKKYYDTTKHQNLNFQFGDGGVQAFTEPTNKVYAKNVLLFQNVTAVLSKILWVFPFLLFFYYRKRSAKK